MYAIFGGISLGVAITSVLAWMVDQEKVADYFMRIATFFALLAIATK